MKFLILLSLPVLLFSCSNGSGEIEATDVCDCVKKQLESNAQTENSMTLIGVCPNLLEGKSDEEKENLRIEYQKCPGYKDLEAIYAPMMDEIKNELLSSDSIDMDNISDIVNENLPR